MFTGIIEAVGAVLAVSQSSADARIGIDAGALVAGDARPGDSISVNGCCLTIVALAGTRIDFDVSHETLARTTLGALAVGAEVNLERALTLASRLGGHLVSGHVDGVGTVESFVADGRSWCCTVAMPRALSRYVAAKGSICVDGTSLTVNRADDAAFTVQIIPHTLENTLCRGYRAGTRVNIEVDLVARYLERLLAPQPVRPAGDPLAV